MNKVGKLEENYSFLV